MTADGGMTWREGGAFGTVGLAVNALTCPVVSSCVAVGEGGLVGTYRPVLRYEATTDAADNYTLEHVRPDTYSLSAARGGYVFTPAVRNVTVPPSAAGQDFTGEFTGSALYLPVLVRMP